MLDLESVGQQIRRARRTLEMTQHDLARAAGLSQSLVAKIEQGKANPSYQAVRDLFQALESSRAAQEQTAGELMQSVIAADPAEAVGKALLRMKKHGFSQMPVLDLGRPVGALSERTVLEAIEQGSDVAAVRKKRVADLMGESFPTVQETTGRRVLVELLREHEAVLVMRKGRVVGVVTRTDLL